MQYAYFVCKMHILKMYSTKGERCAQCSGGETEGRRPLERHRRRWEDNINMDLQEVGGGCVDRMELAQDRDRWLALVSTVMNLRDPKMRGIF